MTVTSNLKSSASALAFFLGPLAWTQPCLEIAALDDKPGIVSDSNATDAVPAQASTGGGTGGAGAAAPLNG